MACFNPGERDGQRIRALEQQLRNMQVSDRTRYLSQNGLDVRAIEDYLAGVACGGLGETALKDFAVQPPNEFSVGFVSLGAGLLLAETVAAEGAQPLFNLDVDITARIGLVAEAVQLDVLLFDLA